MKTPVAITGLGVLSSLGCELNSFWHNLVNGKSGISPIIKPQHQTILNNPYINSHIAGQILDFELAEKIPEISPSNARKMDLFIHYGLYASIKAIEDANLPNFNSANTNSTFNPKRFGVCLGSAFGGVLSYEKLVESSLNGSRSSPFSIPSILINMLSSQVAMNLGYQGLNFSPVSACASSSHSIICAAQSIEMGLNDVVIAGGSEAALCNSVMAGFSAAKSLSRNNTNPEKASRPWDKDRDGFVLSNGSASLVLESLDFAKKRGAKIYGLLTGYGMNSDCYHITSPIETGERAAECMGLALNSAGLNYDEIDYINAHGTSTKIGDLAETRAIHQCFKDHSKKLSVSSSKSMTGHLLGASGAIEALICLLSIQNQKITPTINLDNPDEGCDLNYTPHNAKDGKLKNVLSNSFGFGGVNASLIFSQH